MISLRSSSLLAALLAVGATFAAVYSSKLPSEESTEEAASVTANIDIPPFATWPELRMKDVFRSPVGERGLEYSETARALDGHQVRITGFMAQTDWKDHSQFILATFPLILHDREYGQADEIPSGSVLVKMPEGETAAFTKGLLMLSGTLSLGRSDAPGDRPLWATLELHPDAKHWQPSPSLLSALPVNERSQIKTLMMKQSACSCRQCSQAKATRKQS